MNKPINPGDEKFPVDVTVRRAPNDDDTVTYTLHVPDADDQEICKVAIDMGVAPEKWVYWALAAMLGGASLLDKPTPPEQLN